MFFNHWSEVPENYWKWQYFKPYELASKGDGSLLVDELALNKLEQVRIIIKRPIYINSAYRDDLYNAQIGGAPLSYHVEAKAFDISLENQNKENLFYIAKQVGFTGFGLNYNNFLHVDTGHKRSW